MAVGRKVGIPVGSEDVGTPEGYSDGDVVGTQEGVIVGADVDGTLVGTDDEGMLEGALLGEEVAGF